MGSNDQEPVAKARQEIAAANDEALAEAGKADQALAEAKAKAAEDVAKAEAKAGEQTAKAAEKAAEKAEQAAEKAAKELEKSGSGGQFSTNRGQDLKVHTFVGPDGSVIQSTMRRFHEELKDKGYRKPEDMPTTVPPPVPASGLS